MKKDEVTELTVMEPQGVLKPVGDLNSIVEAFNAYQDAVNKLLTKDDYMSLSGKQFKKKSAWRKLSTAFGITTQVVSREITYDDQGRIHHAEFVVKAIAPNGRSAEAWAGASVVDRKFSHDQDCAATAQTRATNRAIADLIGAGEVSAEEMEGGVSGAVDRETGEIIDTITDKQLTLAKDLLKTKANVKTAGDAKRVLNLLDLPDQVEVLSKDQAKVLIDYLIKRSPSDVEHDVEGD